MKRLQSFLRTQERVAIDTSVFIYALQEHPRYWEFANEVLEWLEQDGHFAVTSTITLAELLTYPYRNSDDKLVAAIYDLFFQFPNLSWIVADLELTDTAARLRARYGMHTPDALQAAAAVRSGATGFITNDFIFTRVTEFETIVLEELV